MSAVDDPPPAEGEARLADSGAFAALAAEPYLSLTTYRRDGTGVPTPVRAALVGGRLLIWTGVASGKVKRLRHSSAVTVAACDRTGSLLDEPVAAHASVLPLSELAEVKAAMTAKYGWQFRIAAFGAGIGRMIGISGPGQVGVEISLD